MQLVDQAENRMALRDWAPRWTIILFLVMLVGGGLGMSNFAFGDYQVCNFRSNQTCNSSHPATLFDRVGPVLVAFIFAGLGAYGLFYTVGTRHVDYTVEKTDGSLSLTIDRHLWLTPATHKEVQADRVLTYSQSATNGLTIWLYFMDGDTIMWSLVVMDRDGLGDKISQFLGSTAQTGTPGLNALVSYIAKSLPIIGPLMIRMVGL